MCCIICVEWSAKSASLKKQFCPLASGRSIYKRTAIFISLCSVIFWWWSILGYSCGVCAGSPFWSGRPLRSGGPAWSGRSRGTCRPRASHRARSTRRACTPFCSLKRRDTCRKINMAFAQRKKMDVGTSDLAPQHEDLLPVASRATDFGRSLHVFVYSPSVMHVWNRVWLIQRAERCLNFNLKWYKLSVVCGKELTAKEPNVQNPGINHFLQEKGVLYLWSSFPRHSGWTRLVGCDGQFQLWNHDLSWAGCFWVERGSIFIAWKIFSNQTTRRQIVPWVHDRIHSAVLGCFGLESQIDLWTFSSWATSESDFHNLYQRMFQLQAVCCFFLLKRSRCWTLKVSGPGSRVRPRVTY